MVPFLCLAVGAITILFGIYKYKIFKSHHFWKARSVPFLEPISPQGNASGIISDFSYCEIVKRYYDAVSTSSDYAGFLLFTEPKLFVTSPEFIKKCLETEFNSFRDRGLVRLLRDPRMLNLNLYRYEGEEWKTQRNMYNSLFSTENVKSLLESMQTPVKEVSVYLDRAQGNDVDVLKLTRRLFTDIGRSCVYGVDAKSVIEPDAELYKATENLVVTNKKRAYFRILAYNFRGIAEKIGLRLYGIETENVLRKPIQKFLADRKTYDIERKCLIQMIIDERVGPHLFKRPEIDSNITHFFISGFEKCSIALTYALTFMAEHEKIQQKAKKEVKKVLAKYNGEFTCDALSEMSLIDRILSETLRLYPPYPFLYRATSTNYKLPNGSVLPKGTAVEIPIYCIHRDQRYYPDPEKFDPDRFTPENIAKRPDFTYLPFGAGPRSCIGSTYGRMQLCLGLAVILDSFTVSLSDKTQLPLQLDKTAKTTVPCGPVMLRFAKS